MILSQWCKLVHNRFGYSIKISEKTEPINLVCCDECGKTFEERNADTIRREKRWGRQLCGTCVKTENGKEFGEIGYKVLTSFSKEERAKYASEAGKISQLKCPDNKGRFSSERWSNLSKKEQEKRVKKASKALHDKLNSDDKLKQEHYLKVFKNSTIGFISKGHNELHEFLKEHGFEQHYQILEMEVDEFNPEIGIVVEYNGDMYHCNPRTWKPDEYNRVIKMTAKEKWERDRNRIFKLRNIGYSTFVVWEEDWASNREYIKERLLKFINKKRDEITKNNKN